MIEEVVEMLRTLWALVDVVEHHYAERIIIVMPLDLGGGVWWR